MKKQLLIIGFVWPEPTSSAAGSRMLQLIHLFLDLDFQITFASTAKRSDKSKDLAAINVTSVAITLNDASFDAFISNLNPEVVLFDRFMTEEQFGWRVAEQCPEALRILDTEDFHGLRKGREAAHKTNENFDLNHLQNKTTKRELASMYRCDLSLMISEAEIEILEKELQFNPKLLHYLPFLLDKAEVEKKDGIPSFEDREHFITVGNFRHPPNLNAVRLLKNDIWTQIRKELPQAQMHVYGAYPNQSVLQLHNEKNGFIVKAYVEDINEVMQSAKVCLAPLQFGAGLKGKLIDAMKNGTPCVMSSIAAEGMFGNQPANGFVTNEHEDFVNEAVKLYTDNEIWEEKSNVGFDVLKNRFNREDHHAIFKKVLEDITTNLRKHRQQNFIGQILQHQSLQSTKYMSKWIEAKNR